MCNSVADRSIARSIIFGVYHFFPSRVDYERLSDVHVKGAGVIGSLVWLRNRISSGLITADIAASDHRPIIPVSSTSVDESPVSARQNFHSRFT